MSTTWRKLLVTMPAGDSMTSAFDLAGGEFSQFAVQLPNPTNYAATASVNIRFMGSNEDDGTFHYVRYSTNPSTATSANNPWEVAVHTSGIVMFEGAAFVRYGKFHALCASTSTGTNATAATEFVIHMKQ